MIRASDASEGKCVMYVSSPGRCRGTSGQIFKCSTAMDSLLVTGSNGTCYNALPSVYHHLQSPSCHHVSICCHLYLYVVSLLYCYCIDMYALSLYIITLLCLLQYLLVSGSSEQITLRQLSLLYDESFIVKVQLHEVKCSQ